MEVPGTQSSTNVHPIKKARGTRASLTPSVNGDAGYTVNDEPQPQPPVAFGLSKAKPDSWKLLL